MDDCSHGIHSSELCGSCIRDKQIASLAHQIEEKDNEIRRLNLGSMTVFDCERLEKWIKEPNREPAGTAFTAGYLRDAARIIEMSDIFFRLESAEKKIEVEHELFLTAHRDNLKAANRIAELKEGLERQAEWIEALYADGRLPKEALDLALEDAKKILKGD